MAATIVSLEGKVMAEFIEWQFNAGEVTINVAEWPDNGPPLLFIHGVTSAWSSWERIVPGFVDSWHCYAIDLRGHGKSGHIPGGYHRDLYAVDPVELIRREIGRPTYIVGHSLGATTAVGVAASIPELVSAVVYEDPPLFSHENREIGASRFGWQLDLIESGVSVNEMAEVIHRHNGGERAAADWKAHQLKRLDPDVLRSTVSGKASENWDVASQLRKAWSPALLLSANPELGGVMTKDWIHRALTLLPNARGATWPDSGHGMHTMFPDRFVKTVQVFFAGVPVG
jgi:pimeloyl-ACP methyl ester carboxylesterase